MCCAVKPLKTPVCLLFHGRDGIDGTEQGSQFVFVHDKFLYESRVCLRVYVLPVEDISQVPQRMHELYVAHIMIWKP